MRPCFWLPALAAAAGCHGAPTPPPTAPATRTAAAPTVTAAAAGPACATPSAPQLTSYLDARVPGTCWLDMVHAGPDWQPAEQLPMPFHHATRIELDNLAAYPQLAAATAGRVRFVLEFTTRDLDHDTARNTWFATYHARIVDACPLP